MKYLISKNKAAARGFTLIELLVVIAIIAILAALLFPVIGKIQSKADDSKCAANLRQIGMAINLYANDNEDRLPGPINSGVSAALDSTKGSSLVYKLQPYLSLPNPVAKPIYAEIFHCPGVKGEMLGREANWWDVTSMVLYSNNDMPTEKRYLPDQLVTDANNTPWPVGPWGRSNSSPATPSWVRAQLQVGVDRTKVDASGVVPSLAIIPALYETDGEYPPRGKSSWPWAVPPKAVHGNHINVLFFDWHVEPMARGTYSPPKKQ